jgi:molybdopterin-containing oxidoreductase family membrane subunit
MEPNYSTIEGKSRGYYILVTILGLMTVGFVASFLVVYLRGHQALEANNIIPWGQLIVFFIFFVGLSAGAIIISSLSYVFKKEAYEPIGRMAVFMGILLMAGAMIFVLVDLGRPEKFWRLFMLFYMNSMTSMFAINSILYSGYILLMVVYLWLIFEGKKKWAVIVGTADVLWAIGVHMGTGAIFGFIGNREIFFSPIKPFEFLTAALTSGTSLTILAAIGTFKVTKRVIREEWVLSLGRLLSYFILILTVMVFIDKMTHLYSPNREATVYLLTGDYWYLFWIFQIGLGIVFPLILLFHPKTGKTVKGIVVASASVVIGVFGERAALVIPGTAFPQPFFPGKIEGTWGAPGIFHIVPWETLLCFGIISYVGLLFVLGLKYLEILPARDKEDVPATESPVSQG